MQVESIIRMRYRSAVLILLSGAMLAAVAGCHRAPSADVVATVNGKEIMRADMDRNYKASLGDAPQKLSPEEADIRRLTILHGMIEDEILQQRAAKLNLAATDEDVNAKLTEIKAPYTQEEFDNQLKARDLSLDDFKRDIRRSLTKTKLINKEIESRINITDAEISGYYAAHKAEFNLIEPQYHLAQIVATSAPSQQAGNLQNNKASGDADAKKKIQVLHNRLESGEDFSAVAMNFSEDLNTASNGGDMGFIAESALKGDPQVYDALSKLKPGQFTDVLPVYDGAGPGHRTIGYAIYRLLSRDPAGQRELNDPRVQQAIHTQLHNNRAQLLQNAYFEVLQDDAKVHSYLAEQILKMGAQ
ncbi:MAG TPA: SurA N-terminal domain-containing protein [Terracidiphilus sp.]|nr:SurA N-terminal domain-containing protein [Terracidiphilus sp.]